jgi:hypothetical protein
MLRCGKTNSRTARGSVPSECRASAHGSPSPPREKETVGLLRWRDPNGTIPRSCGRIRPFWKRATSNKQIVGALTTGNPARVAAKAVIVTEVERLRWRIWNGKAKNARKSIIRIRAVMHHFRGEPGSRKSVAPSRKLWPALHALDGYLTGQSTWLVNYAELHRAGLRVGTAITEGTANLLVNRRMNKSQQMRWSRRGTDLPLQVRCANDNGTLGFDFGQKFYPANDVSPPTAVAALPPVSRRSRQAGQHPPPVAGSKACRNAPGVDRRHLCPNPPPWKPPPRAEWLIFPK